MVRQAPDAMLVVLAIELKWMATEQLDAGGNWQKTQTYLVRKRALWSPLLVFLHLHPSFLNGLFLCKNLRIFSSGSSLPLALTLSLLTLLLLLASCLFLLCSAPALYFTLLIKLALCFFLVLTAI